MLADDALRMRCHTACSWRGRAHNVQWLPAVALLAPRTATWARIARRPPRRSTACRRSKHSRHRWLLFRGASFAVSPSPKHASTPVTSTTPAALAVARSQQTGCRHGTKERVLEAQGWQSLFPSIAESRRFLRTGGGSSLDADLLLLGAALNIIPRSPGPRVCLL